MKAIRGFIEPRVFGVCSFFGDFFGIPSYHIRLFFVYASFVTLGSPILIYLGLAFLLNLHKYMKSRRSSVWDL